MKLIYAFNPARGNRKPHYIHAYAGDPRTDGSHAEVLDRLNLWCERQWGRDGTWDLLNSTFRFQRRDQATLFKLTNAP